MTNEIQYTCPFCGAVHTITVYPSINVAEEPALKSAVMDGSLFVRECPSCGQKYLVKGQTLYHDPDIKLMIWLSDGDAAREATLQQTFRQTEGMGAYTARFVDDIGSLMEKVKIFDAGLDDVLVEMCKMVTCMEMKKSLPFKFFRIDGADNDILLTYPQNGEMEIVTIGFNVYEDCRGIVSRNPGMKEKTIGFQRIDSRWISQFFG